MPDSYGNYHANLRESAVKYRNLGWSVIPIRGDSDPKNPKAAAVSWTQFQQRHPTVTEIESWFGESHFGGLAIVCGPVSGLIVLDFDDPDCAAAFSRACPDLTQTYTVMSGQRGLPHYYFHAAADTPVATRHTPGADLQAAGTYVIAPPTCIAGSAWNNSYGSELLTLNAADIERIRIFLDAYHYVEPTAQLASENLLVGSSAADLIRQYVYLARQIGRNNALFRVGSLARDTGWSLTATTEALLDSHIGQPPNGLHPEESPKQRRQEGVRTLVSVFRYPPKPCVQTVPPRLGLPNTIREGLLQQGNVAVARLLDGLLMAGIKAGAVFTEKIACQLLRIYGIGRRSVQAALKVLECIESPRNPPKAQSANAAEMMNKEDTNCFFVTGANRVKTFGRRPQQWTLPTNGQLYRWLGARPSGSDRLDAAALQSPATYRQALQKALIERRPGHYSRQWLSERLGISVWTCRRYDTAIGLTVRASYHEDRICWSNLERLPLKSYAVRPTGVFIQAVDGRRFPPLRRIAARLLEQKQSIVLKRRHWNFYQIYSEYYEQLSKNANIKRQVLLSEEIHKQTEAPEILVGEALASLATMPHMEPTTSLLIEPAEPEKYLWLCPGCMKTHLRHEHPGSCDKCKSAEWERISAAIWADVERCKTWWRARYHQHQREQLQPKVKTPPLHDRQQRAADQLYMSVQKRTPEHAITRGTACRLVREYGIDSVEEALKQMQLRSTIYNAAGFVITMLRGRESNATPHKSSSADDHAAWVERLRQSPYAQYYANVDEFLTDLIVEDVVM